MKSSQPKSVNRRKSQSRLRRTQSLLEVTVRSKAAIEQRNRFILAWSCRILLAAATVGAVVYGVREGMRRMFWENPEYRLATVELNDDGKGLTREMIMEKAGIQLGQNLFSFSLTKAREAISTMPQVERVELRRVMPNKVAIDLSERRPVAWVAENPTEDPSASDSAFLVDAKRVLFKPRQKLPEYFRLPIIGGVALGRFAQGHTVDLPEVVSAIELIQRSGEGARFQIQSIDISKGYCLVATDAKRTRVTFGLENIDRQLERLGIVLDRFATAQPEIQTVNLLVERNTPVTFVPPPGAEPVKASAASSATASQTTTPKPIKEKATAKTSAEASPKKKKAADKKGDSSNRAQSQPVKRAEPAIPRAQPVTSPDNRPTASNQTSTRHG
jgi:cell division protein FtsQ